MKTMSMSISCLALMLMILGLVHKKWVTLNVAPEEQLISSSPWITEIHSNYIIINPTDKKRIVFWDLMAMIIFLSVILSFILGMDYTNMIPPFKGRYLIFSLISFFTGSSMFTAIILYKKRLKEVFRTSSRNIKVNWIFHSAYVIIFLYLVCGILCLLQHSRSNKSTLDLLQESSTCSSLRQPESTQIQTDDRKSKESFPEKKENENLDIKRPIARSKLISRQVTKAL
ncbi:transmembrane protein 225 isoform X2 [Macrotis lagotis]|uniref:transmembrane protein 225 isoform X2 n=1 Tax=Macrotis lagotis TaxID=92651 RepID=UPI003D68BCF9